MQNWRDGKTEGWMEGGLKCEWRYGRMERRDGKMEGCRDGGMQGWMARMLSSYVTNRFPHFEEHPKRRLVPSEVQLRERPTTVSRPW